MFDLAADPEEISKHLAHDYSSRIVSRHVPASGFPAPGMDLNSRFAPFWGNKSQCAVPPP